MKLLVTGSRGQLGRALERTAPLHGCEFYGYDLPELDITDRSAVAALARTVLPDVIVNCAAFTGVDAAESHEEEALAVNGTAVAHLAETANEVGAVLVQISTDYVFDGRDERPRREDDSTNPLSAYGRTKLAGEHAAASARAHLIVRTAWLFGEGGANFVEAIRRQLAAGSRCLRVVADQHGSPTYAGDLAATVLHLVELSARGLVHAVNAGSTTWLGFAGEIVRQLAAAVEVEPISTQTAARPAPRPQFSVLDTTRLTGLLGAPLPPWQDALSRYLARTPSQAAQDQKPGFAGTLG
ncbi:MAG: dTDP-4-dehydrorhamnose reductase [Thermoanaerobaculales bacterium]